MDGQLTDNLRSLHQRRLLVPKVHLQFIPIVHNGTNGGIDGSAIAQFDLAFESGRDCEGQVRRIATLLGHTAGESLRDSQR